jgi:hypothetical protein
MFGRLAMAAPLVLVSGCSEAAFQCERHEECGSCGVCQNGACVLAQCDGDTSIDDDAANEADAQMSVDGGELRAVLRAAPSSYDFGSVALGRPAAAFIEIENVGDVSAEIERSMIDPPFRLVSDGCSGAVLAALEACTIDVSFEALALGRATSVLAVASGADLRLDVPLSAEGATNAHLVFSPELEEIGAVQVGDTFESRVVLENVGGVDAIDLRVELGGSHPSEFAIDGGCDRPVLARAETCTVAVTFAPRTPGSAKRATVLARDAQGGFGLGAITGTGLARAELVARHTHQFITAVVGTMRPSSIWLDNVGGGETGALSRVLGGPDAAEFSLDQSCEGQSIPARGSCQFSFSFAPLSLGSKKATVEVRSPRGSTIVEIEAEAEPQPAPAIAVPSILEFGQLVLGAASPWIYPELQYGEYSSPGGNGGLTGPDASEFRVVPNFCDGGASICGYGVEFRPTSTGTKSATFTATYSAGSVNIPLTGGGVGASSLRFTTARIFEILPGTSTRNYTLTLRNYGSSASGPIAVQLAGPTDYSIVSDTCNGTSLSANATCAVGVRMVPSSSAEKHALLRAATSPGDAFVPLGYIIQPPRVVVNAVDDVSFPGGRVVAPGFDCPSDCRVRIPPSTPTTFTAIAEPNYVFTNWITGHMCGSANPCTIQPSSGPVDATPRFQLVSRTLDVQVDARGGASGFVSAMPQGVACSSACSYVFPHSTTMTLVASPESTFVGWRGDCEGAGTTCVVNLTDHRDVTAEFSTSPNLVFVTSTTVAIASLSRPEVADRECERVAREAGIPGRYGAWISTGTIAALSRIATIVPEPRGWVRPDGAPFAESIFDLLHDRILFPPLFTERGEEISETELVATGTFARGESGFTCFDWSSTKSYVQAGAPHAGSHGWTEMELASCSNPNTRLYCFGLDHDAPIDIMRRQGDRIAFLTHSTWDPSSGLASADTLCQDEANFGGLLGEFRAFLATSNSDALARFAAGPPWSRTDGVPLVDDLSDLSFGLRAALTVEADGRTHAGDALVWSGIGSSCLDWTSSAANDFGSIGVASLTTERWLDGSVPSPCSERHRVYCFQE